MSDKRVTLTDYTESEDVEVVVKREMGEDQPYPIYIKIPEQWYERKDLNKIIKLLQRIKKEQ